MDIPLTLRPAGGRLYAQIRAGIQDLVVRGVLPPGTRLPPVRGLARQLKVDYFTVLRAYRELEAMGYLELDVGVGTYVAHDLPDTFLKAKGDKSSGKATPPPASVLRTLPAPVSGMQYVSPPKSPSFPAPRIVFTVGSGDVRLFPATTWRRLHDRQFKDLARSNALYYGDPRGALSLREAIREEILPARGIRAGPDEILVLSGGLSAIHQFLQAALAPGDGVALEDPASGFLATIIAESGGRILPVPVDRKGIDLDRLRAVLARRKPRAVIVTPSHQYPTCAVLDAGRRHKLLAMTAGLPVWVVEDDYDHEFHYDSPPLPSLKSLDATGQVVYVGSFSKVLFPSIRTGFVVAPRAVIDRLAARVVWTNTRLPQVPQLVLADFIRDGHYAHHIRRMRRIYQSRRDAMAAAFEKHLPDFAFETPRGGMRFWVRLPRGIESGALREEAARLGVSVVPAPVHSATGQERRHLHLGFASVDEDEISAGLRILGKAARSFR